MTDEQNVTQNTEPVEGFEPAKVMRIGTMVKQLLEEVKAAPVDAAARETLASIHTRSLQELKGALSDELSQEIDRIVLPLEAEPSESEIRIAHAQLVGWLEGLFHGIQTALMAQQMMAKNQLSSMRRGLPTTQGSAPEPTTPGERPPGQYL